MSVDPGSILWTACRFTVTFRRYCKLVSVTADIPKCQWTQVRFYGQLFYLFFFGPSSVFPPLSFSQTKSWHGFNPYQIPIFFSHSFSFLPFFPSFALFPPPFFYPPLISSSPFPLLSSFFLSPIPIPFLLFLLPVSFFLPLSASPFCCFSFSLSSNQYSVTVLIIGSHMYVQVRKSLN